MNNSNSSRCDSVKKAIFSYWLRNGYRTVVNKIGEITDKDCRESLRIAVSNR